MLSRDEADKIKQVIGRSTLAKIAQLLGHNPNRTISISMDAEYVHTEFIDAEGRLVTESLEVQQDK